MNIKLSKIASLLSRELKGWYEIYNLTIDSREVKSGDIFVAIEGKNWWTWLHTRAIVMEHGNIV